MPFPVVDRAPTLGDQVYQTLRTHLRHGSVAGGESFHEAQLAEQMGVSRTPVREALTRLANEGLLVQGRRSFMTPELTRKDLDDIYQIRFLVEPEALRSIAARTVDPVVRAPIEAAMAATVAADRSGDVKAFRDANARFRAAWLALVTNERLVKVIDLHADHMQHVRALTLGNPEIRAIVLRNLERVMAALRLGDSEAAAQAMLEHLAGAKRAYIAAVGLDEGDSQSGKEDVR
jgi:DNA-binding GntR family transcriptional regulator